MSIKEVVAKTTAAQIVLTRYDYLLVRIEDVLCSEQMVSSERNYVLLEGELWKYHPGFSQQFFKKWCILSKDGFQYYKTRWSAGCAIDCPLTFIPTENIRLVQRIPDSRDGSARKTVDADFGKYQFELFTKAPAYEAEMVDSLPKSDNSRAEVTQDNSAVQGYLMKPPFRPGSRRQEIEGEGKYYEWTQRELGWYEAETRLLFVAENELDLQRWLVVFNWLISNQSLQHILLHAKQQLLL